jgi:hypothetical protein
MGQGQFGDLPDGNPQVVKLLPAGSLLAFLDQRVAPQGNEQDRLLSG